MNKLLDSKNLLLRFGIKSPSISISVNLDGFILRINSVKFPLPGPTSNILRFSDLINLKIFCKIFLSTYHDQALIPFKILNKKAINMTVGLNFRRLSPAHGTAKDIINKNISDNTSYLSCMLD